MYIKKSFTLIEALSDSDRVGKHFYGWDYSCEDDYDPLTCTCEMDQQIIRIIGVIQNDEMYIATIFENNHVHMMVYDGPYYELKKYGIILIGDSDIIVYIPLFNN